MAQKAQEIGAQQMRICLQVRGLWGPDVGDGGDPLRSQANAALGFPSDRGGFLMPPGRRLSHSRSVTSFHRSCGVDDHCKSRTPIPQPLSALLPEC